MPDPGLSPWFASLIRSSHRVRRWIVIMLLALCVLPAAFQAPPMAVTAQTPAEPLDSLMYVIDFNGTVSSYSPATGERLQTILTATNERRARGVISGPDGRIYVSVGSAVLRYDGATGAYIDTLGVEGGRSVIVSMAFGPEGDLYLLEYPDDFFNEAMRIRRISPINGAERGIVAENLRTPYPPPGATRLIEPGQIGFDAAGRLYMIDNVANVLVRYNPTIRAFTETIIGPTERIFYGSAFTFGPDGAIYVSEGLVASLTNRPRSIFRYNADGTPRDTFTAAAPNPSGIRFGPANDVFVVSDGNLLHFDGRTGALVRNLIAGNVAGTPQSFAFAGGALPTPARPINPALVTVAQRSTPARSIAPGTPFTLTLTAINHGRGMAQQAEIRVPFDPTRVQVLEAQFSRPTAWVRRHEAAELVIETGTLGGRGDKITATIHMVVAADAPDGTLFTTRPTVRWRDAAGGGASTSNRLPLSVGVETTADSTLVLAVAPERAPAGSSHTFSATLFLPNEAVALWYDTPEGRTVALGRAGAAPDGTLVYTLKTANFAPGHYTLVAEGVWSEVSAIGTFTVTP